MGSGTVHSPRLSKNKRPTLLDQLDKLKTSFDAKDASKVQSLLEQLSHKSFRDVENLVRYHELLLFVRAFPHNAAVMRLAEAQLRAFPKRISELREREIDLSWLEHPDVSGIAGSSVTDTFSFYLVRRLVQRYPSQLSIYWDWFEDENRLAETWPRFMPLLEEDALVEANVPYRKWLDAARGRKSELSWLIEQFDSLQLPDKEKAELYNAQKIYVRWTPRFASTRTGMRADTKSIFYHEKPFIQRRDINLKDELQAAPPEWRRLSSNDGERALDLAREASTIRYRELYGFTHGDPSRVYEADLGRGVQLFLFGLPAEWRLPLRTYHAAMFFKNGVPIGYFEALALFERLESGLNLYYTFRDGETAWLYSRTLNLMHHFLGVTSFAIDPYQIGYQNEEGIKSGAFWFYRKLGFRPTKREALQLVEKEEQKIAAVKDYRTSARTLRKFAESPMIFELDEKRVGDWDDFQVRKIGFRVQGRWSSVEKQLSGKLSEAKNGPEEIDYLKSMRRDEKLRAEIIKLGS